MFGAQNPFKVFAQLVGKDYFLNGSVALMGRIRQLLTGKTRVKITGE